MSGGSYNYLCWKDAEELMTMLDTIERMADDLAALGYAPDAANETYLIARDLRRLQSRLNAILDGKQGLRNVWRAKEWWKSRDGTEESFKEALAKYRGEGGN